MKDRLFYALASFTVSCASPSGEGTSAMTEENPSPCSRAVPSAVMDTSVYKGVRFERISDDYAEERFSTTTVNVEIEHTGCEYYTLIYNVSFRDDAEDGGMDAALAQMKDIAAADVSPIRVCDGVDSLMAARKRGENITAAEIVYMDGEMPATVSARENEGKYRFVFKMGPL